VAKDIYHYAVKRALEKDGWQITHDPLTIYFEEERLFVDLGAERLLAAEKETVRIAVEVKSFLSASSVTDLHNALGQYAMYEALLEIEDPSRILVLAVPRIAEPLFQRPLGKLLIERFKLRMMIVETDEEVIDSWIPHSPA
jgi:XisH protein